MAALVFLVALPAGQVAAARPVLIDPHPGSPEERVCVPPGLPPFSTWRGGPANFLISEDEWRRPVVVVARDYLAGGQPVRTFWVGGFLALVDAAPANPNEPAWQDTGVVATDMAPRAAPAQSCRWVKPSPPPKPEEKT